MKKSTSPEGHEIVDSLTQPKEARVQAYAEILAVTKECLNEYARRHPERAVDERHQEGLECSVFGVSVILEILDRYDIQYKDGEVPKPLPKEKRKR
jgi:hypothetical protein